MWISVPAPINSAVASAVFELDVADRDCPGSPPRQLKCEGPTDAGPRASYYADLSSDFTQAGISSFAVDFRSIWRNSMYSSATLPSRRNRESFA